MKKLSLLMSACLISLSASAAVFEYTDLQGNKYYTSGMPRGLNDIEKTFYIKLSNQQVDQMAPVLLHSRSHVKTLMEADMATPADPPTSEDPPVVDDPVVEPPVVIDPPVVDDPIADQPLECPVGMHLNDAGDACVGHGGHHGELPVVDTSKVPAPAAGSASVDIRPETYSPDQKYDNTGDFRLACGFSHMSNDDPIVYPNQQGAAHHHTFFGNTGTNFMSTPESILTTGNSTCHGGLVNRSAYWVPSMIDTSTNTPLEPSILLVYYKTQLADQVSYMPEGLRMIAKPTDYRQTTQFTCNEVYDTRKVLEIPECNQGGSVQVMIDFPNCWDGENLDSPNHTDHMAYTIWSDECPASHPVRIPNITFTVHYPVATAAGTAHWRLSSDAMDTVPGSSLHADWMNGWDKMFEEAFIDNCLKGTKDCHANLLGDGRELIEN